MEQPVEGRRLPPDQRRQQLLEVGVRMLATHRLEEMSLEALAAEARISRGLIYHYFGSKHEFHAAVVRRTADSLMDRTMPPAGDSGSETLLRVVAAYIDYVEESPRGYVSLMRVAAGGPEELLRIHDDVRRAIAERLHEGMRIAGSVDDTPLSRILVRGAMGLVEEVVLNWVERPDGVTRDQVMLAAVRAVGALAAVSKDPRSHGQLADLAAQLAEEAQLRVRRW